MAQTQTLQKQDDITIIGHRGASGYEPENTLASFKKALSLGVDMIEFDVYILASGEVVVIHDDKVDRTTDGTGYVEKFTYKQLRALNAGKGQKVPTLREVLNLIRHRVPVTIELKGEGTAQPVAGLIREYVDEHDWKPEQFAVLSFNHTELARFAARMPHIRVGASFEGEPKHLIKEAQRLGASLAVLDAQFIRPQVIETAHAGGIEVYAYTVNTQTQARQLRHLHVDGVFSDYPDRVAKSLAPSRRPVSV